MMISRCKSLHVMRFIWPWWRETASRRSVKPVCLLPDLSPILSWLCSKTISHITREKSGTIPGRMNTISFQQVRTAPKTFPIVYEFYIIECASSNLLTHKSPKQTWKKREATKSVLFASLTSRPVKPTRVSKACASERCCSCNSKSSMVSVLSIWTAEEAGCVSFRRWRMSTSRLRTFFWNTEINKYICWLQCSN